MSIRNYTNTEGLNRGKIGGKHLAIDAGDGITLELTPNGSTKISVIGAGSGVVNEVNGYTGNVTLNTEDIPETLNKYYMTPTDTQNIIDIQTQINTVNVPFGYTQLDANAKVPVEQLPNSIVIYRGTYDIITNTPPLDDSTAVPEDAGDVYLCVTAGTRDFNPSGPPNIVTVVEGDYLIYNGSQYQRSPSASYTRSETDALFVFKAGDTMTGDLTVPTLYTDYIGNGFNTDIIDLTGADLKINKNIDLTFQTITASTEIHSLYFQGTTGVFDTTRTNTIQNNTDSTENILLSNVITTFKKNVDMDTKDIVKCNDIQTQYISSKAIIGGTKIPVWNLTNTIGDGVKHETGINLNLNNNWIYNVSSIYTNGLQNIAGDPIMGFTTKFDIFTNVDFNNSILSEINTMQVANINNYTNQSCITLTTTQIDAFKTLHMNNHNISGVDDIKVQRIGWDGFPDKIILNGTGIQMNYLLDMNGNNIQEVGNFTNTGTTTLSALNTAGVVHTTAATGVLTTSLIVANDITNATITGAKLVNNTITATQIANATITATQIANTTLTNALIVNNTIANNKLVAEPVTTNTANRIALRGASGEFSMGALTCTSVDSGTGRVDCGTLDAYGGQSGMRYAGLFQNTDSNYNNSCAISLALGGSPIDWTTPNVFGVRQSVHHSNSLGNMSYRIAMQRYNSPAPQDLQYTTLNANEALVTTLRGALVIDVDANIITPSCSLTVKNLGTGVVHSSSTGLLSSSLIVNADITNSTIADAKLASTVSTTATINSIAKRDGFGSLTCSSIILDTGILLNGHVRDTIYPYSLTWVGNGTALQKTIDTSLTGGIYMSMRVWTLSGTLETMYNSSRYDVTFDITASEVKFTPNGANVWSNGVTYYANVYTI